MPSVNGIDIFCKVIDNFGDIGICWRLARQLRQAQTGPIRLWVDELAPFARLDSRVNTSAAQQRIDAIDIVHWQEPLPDLQPYAVVIEAFACDLPTRFISQMAATQSLWINLEYLSAESWASEWHGLPSLQANGLNKYFYFPGFTDSSGGLLREPGLLERRDAWLSQAESRSQLWARLKLPKPVQNVLSGGALQILFFCYPGAPLEGLVHALAKQEKSAVILVPEAVMPHLSEASKAATRNTPVQLVKIPFVDQNTFDQILWCSSLNLVRGEDSVLRASWAGRPFLWHIYPQPDSAHLPKLEAWLALQPITALTALTRAWNAADTDQLAQLLAPALQGSAWQLWQNEAHHHAATLARQTSLVTRLLAFIEQKQAEP